MENLEENYLYEKWEGYLYLIERDGLTTQEWQNNYFVLLGMKDAGYFYSLDLVTVYSKDGEIKHGQAVELVAQKENFDIANALIFALYGKSVKPSNIVVGTIDDATIDYIVKI